LFGIFFWKVDQYIWIWMTSMGRVGMLASSHKIKTRVRTATDYPVPLNKRKWRVGCTI